MKGKQQQEVGNGGGWKMEEKTAYKPSALGSSGQWEI